jgi:uncharacterized membrane protein
METCLSNPAINCSFFLFQSAGTIIEINLVGAVLPLLLSACLLFHYRERLHWPRIIGFTLASFAIITAIGSAVGAVYGTIAIMGWVYILFWLLIVSWYSRLRFVRADARVTAGELYVVGTLGVFLDDVVRTFLGFLNVPVVGLAITPNIWGAGGPLDGIFMTGLYQVLIYFLMANIMSVIRPARVR